MCSRLLNKKLIADMTIKGKIVIINEKMTSLRKALFCVFDQRYSINVGYLF